MIDDDKKENDETETAEEAVEENAEAANDDAAAAADAEPTPEDVIQKLVAENADLKDRLMRALAEVENIRRRSDKDRQDQAKFGVSPLAKELIPVADNLHRALEAKPTEAIEADPAIKNFVLGIEMTEKQLQDVFAKVKIERINPKGEKFSYKLHQAMSELENTGQPAGTVVEVIAAGYILNERLLRPAMVIVAKGDVVEAKPDDVEHVDTTA